MNVILLRRVSALAAAAALTSGLAACGGSSSDSSSVAKSSATQGAASSSGGGQKLSLDASESGGLKFTKSVLNSKSGSVTITMTNPSGDKLPHAIAIEGQGVSKDGAIAQPGSKSTITVHLKPGKYTFFCPVGNHRQQGMEGTLTVS